MRPSSGQSKIYVANPACSVSKGSLTVRYPPTLKKGTTPTDRVSNQSLPLHQLGQIPQRHVVSPLSVFTKHILELLWYKPSFSVVCARVTAMLVLMNVGNVDSEQRVGQE